MNKLKKQQSVFTKRSIIQDAATEASSIVLYKPAKRSKPFSDGEFIKECMTVSYGEFIKELLQNLPAPLFLTIVRLI